MSNLYHRLVELLLGPICRAATIAPDHEEILAVKRCSLRKVEEEQSLGVNHIADNLSYV